MMELSATERANERDADGGPEHHSSPVSKGDASEAWHAVDAAAALHTLNARREGLSEADAADRLARYGPNALPAAKGRSVLQRLLAQFNNVLIYVLLAASVVTALLGHYTDTGVILAVVLVNAGIGFWQEGKAENALAAVKGMLSPHASVVRGGHRTTIPAADVVPGDIVVVEAGDRVPADLRLTETRGLRIEEAALTGESVPADKATSPVAEDAALGDRASMAFSGTMVTAGRGVGMAVATGAQTEIGRIGAMLEEIGDVKTPLLAQIDRFGKWLTAVVLVICAAVFAIAVGLRDYAADEAFLAMVGMAVAAIPEGLPAVITITLAIGVQRMAARRAIIRRLPAIETLGAVSAICTDKTGTLTKNEMVVRALIPAGADEPIAVTGEGYAPEGEIASDGAAVEALVLTGLLCNDAALTKSSEGAWEVAGDPMDGALVALAHKAGLDPDTVRADHRRVADVPFDSATRYAATLNEGPDGAAVHVKGAAATVLTMCGGDAVDPDRWSALEDRLARDGQRVLAFATKRVEAGTDIDDAVKAGNFTLMGLAGFVDPPRAEAVKAVAQCHAAGIAVKMITGDHKTTAVAIANELGLARNGKALTGAEIDDIDAGGLAERTRDVAVFARAAPEHKLRLVEAFQANGNVIAMTGDGVNDAPALKRADVGVAMGIKGTEAAKEASKVVLTDDNFATIAAAVREGRTITDNIRKVIAWTLPTNGGESLIVMGAILLGLTLPITPVQILWINMITAVALGLTLAFDPPAPDVMRRPPRPASQALIDRQTLWRIVFVSMLMAGAVFVVHAWSLGRGDSVAYARTLSVNTVVAIEIAYLFAVRYAPGTGIAGWLGTRAVWTGIGVTLLAQAVFTYVPQMQAVFETEAVRAADLLALLVLIVAATVFMEGERRLRERLLRGAGPRPREARA